MYKLRGYCNVVIILYYILQHTSTHEINSIKKSYAAFYILNDNIFIIRDMGKRLSSICASL